MNWVGHSVQTGINEEMNLPCTIPREVPQTALPSAISSLDQTVPILVVCPGGSCLLGLRSFPLLWSVPFPLSLAHLTAFTTANNALLENNPSSCHKGSAE